MNSRERLEAIEKALLYLEFVRDHWGDARSYTALDNAVELLNEAMK
jgi:hypothetical protein